VKYLALASIFLFLVGCGGSPAVPASPLDAQLVALWHGAQDALATQPITLNAAMVAEGKESPVVIAPDMRAMDVKPDGVTVTVVAEVMPGAILAPQNAGGVQYCHSYVVGSAIYVAASLKYSAGATGYEMQNIILSRLGYSVGGR